MIRRRALLWGVAIAYLATSYLTLERAPFYWRELDRALGGSAGELLIAVYVVLAAAGVVWLARGPRRPPSSYAVMAGLALAFAAAWVVERGAAEKFHMLQYGVFGALVWAALRMDLDPRGVRLYVVGSAIGIVAGLVDELIQGQLASRVFTLHDVVVNGGSALGAMVLLWAQLRRTSS